MDTHAAWQLAERIAERLFTCGDGAKAKRLELKDEHELALGGWCQAAVVTQIQKILVSASSEVSAPSVTDLPGLLGEIDLIAVEVSRHGSAEKLALELIRMKLDPVFKKGSRKDGLARLRRETTEHTESAEGT